MDRLTTPQPKKPVELTRREAQLIARLRQLRNAGKDRAEVELVEDGPRVVNYKEQVVK